jgi:hypothetical protein
MEMSLPMRLGIFDPLLEDLLRLLNELPMQVDRVLKGWPRKKIVVMTSSGKCGLERENRGPRR